MGVVATPTHILYLVGDSKFVNLGKLLGNVSDGTTFKMANGVCDGATYANFVSRKGMGFFREVISLRV